MAAPVIDNLVLPQGTLLILEDGLGETTGTIFRHSAMGGGRFHDTNSSTGIPSENTHVLFVKEMTTEVIVDGVEYLAMPASAVVGIIP